jgi:nucleoside-diphosphate-sugar epimerase
MTSLLIFGLGYSGSAVATAAQAAGFAVMGTSRSATLGRVGFDQAEPVLATATHVLTTVPPDAAGDPVLARYGASLAAATALRWIGYLSSTVVYGDRGGDWVDEDTIPAPSQERGHRRLAAERAWAGFGDRIAVEIFRLGGIYGPGRSAFDTLRSGRARRMVKPGHQFGRIHRDDIAGAVVAAMRQSRPAGTRILNLVDDEPAENAAVIEEAASLLGVPPPPEIAFADAMAAMSPMARSFWAENRKVASRKTRSALMLTWRYPSYREGLGAILEEERAQGSAK